MLNLDKVHIKEYFSGDSLDDFELFVNSTCENYQKQFAFLKIKKERWEDLFLRVTKRHLGSVDVESAIKHDIDGIILNTIKARFDNNKILLLECWLKQFSVPGKTYFKVLSDFVNTIGEYGITIEQDLYEKLKKESVLFKYILNNIGIFSFDKPEFDAFLAGKYNNYLLVKGNKVKLLDCITLANYFYGLIGISKDLLLSDKCRIADSMNYKVKFLISNDNLLRELYDIYIKRFGYIDKKEFDKKILELDVKVFNSLFESYNNYKLTSHDNYLDNVYRIFGKLNVVVENVGKKVELSESEDAVDLDIYSLFVFSKEISVEESNTIIDLLVDDLILVNKRKLNSYINGSIAKTAVNGIIKGMQKKYNQRVDKYLSPCTIEFLVPDVEGITKEHKQFYIESWLNSLSDTEKEQIEAFLEGDIYLAQKDFEEAEKRVNSFLNSYRTLTDRALNPISIYSLIEPKLAMSEEIKNEIVDKIFLSYDLEQRQFINDYLQGMRFFSSKEVLKFGQKINNLKNDFNVYVSLIDGIISYFQMIIVFQYKIQLDSMCFDKMYILGRELMEVEEIFKCVLEIDDKAYKEFWKEKVQQLYEHNSTLNLEQLVRLYIKLLYEEIKSRQEKVAL